jgi:hypothetical protein
VSQVGESSRIATAKLCCALNCQEPATNGEHQRAKVSFLPVLIIKVENALKEQDVQDFGNNLFFMSHIYTRGSKPTYIRNSALLI